MELPQLDDYAQLFASDTAMIDVRAPVEYLHGAFPHTQNLPLMNNEERESVGIEYKEMGQDSAIELGHKLVSGTTKDQRINDWAQFIKQHPQGVLYCFRGGLRSRISQQWIFEETGIVYPRIKGGYKAMRSFLLDELEIASTEIHPIILSGRTGVGKTILLQNIEHKIDLEDIFKHRGSAFGKRITPQPSQIDAENELAIALLKLRRNNIRNIIMEDESRSIGSRKIPENIFDSMSKAPLIIVDADIQYRVNIIFEEYIVNALAEHKSLFGETQGFDIWADGLLSAIDKIQRRLGGLKHKQVKSIMEDAINRHQDEKENHKDWIKILLEEYYDPMYDYQLSNKSDRVIFRGEHEDVLTFLRDNQNIR